MISHGKGWRSYDPFDQMIRDWGWLAGLESDRVQAKVVDGNERRLDDVGWMDGWMGWMD